MSRTARTPGGRSRDSGRTATVTAPEAWRIRRPDWKCFKPTGTARTRAGRYTVAGHQAP